MRHTEAPLMKCAHSLLPLMEIRPIPAFIPQKVFPFMSQTQRLNPLAFGPGPHVASVCLGDDGS